MAKSPEQALEVGVGKGIMAKVEGDMLYLCIDLKNDFGVSGSGKSRIIASTNGNIAIPGTDNAILGLNLYRKL